MSQDEFRELLTDLRNDSIDVEAFATRVQALSDRLVKLKRIRIELAIERKELD